MEIGRSVKRVEKVEKVVVEEREVPTLTLEGDEVRLLAAICANIYWDDSMTGRLAQNTYWAVREADAQFNPWSIFTGAEVDSGTVAFTEAPEAAGLNIPNPAP